MDAVGRADEEERRDHRVRVFAHDRRLRRRLHLAQDEAQVAHQGEPANPLEACWIVERGGRIVHVADGGAAHPLMPRAVEDGVSKPAALALEPAKHEGEGRPRDDQCSSLHVRPQPSRPLQSLKSERQPASIWH